MHTSGTHTALNAQPQMQFNTAALLYFNHKNFVMLAEMHTFPGTLSQTALHTKEHTPSPTGLHRVHGCRFIRRSFICVSAVLFKRHHFHPENIKDRAGSKAVTAGPVSR